MGIWKALINVDHIEKERWGPPLVDYDWYAFCQALYKGIEGEDWGEMYAAYKEMSRAMGGEEATGGPQSKNPLENDGGQGCRRRILRPVKTVSKEETRHHVALWEEHLKDPIVALEKALKVCGNQY